MDYVTQPDLSKVTNGAIRGLLESLDPYSTYFTPEQFKNYQENPTAGPANVGVVLSKRMGFRRSSPCFRAARLSRPASNPAI